MAPAPRCLGSWVRKGWLSTDQLPCHKGVSPGWLSRKASVDRGAGLKVERPLGQDQGQRLGAEGRPCPTSSRKQGPVLPPRS